jgi:zinc transport system permease protein
MESILQYQFIQNAIITSILSSIVCGIIGVIIVEKKLVMMSGGIAHTSYGGVGLGFLLGFEPIFGAFIFSILSALGIGHINRSGKSNSDVFIGLLWAFGMSLGILFIFITPGYPPELTSYLFGNILTVNRVDLILMAIFSFVIVAIFILFFNHWKCYLFDNEFSKIIGINISLLDNTLYILIALSVVILMKSAGIILILALFTAPTAISSLFTKKLENRIFLSIFIGITLSLSGLTLSYLINLPSGASIAILGSISYFISYFISNLFKKRVDLATN